MRKYYAVAMKFASWFLPLIGEKEVVKVSDVLDLIRKITAEAEKPGLVSGILQDIAESDFICREVYIGFDTSCSAMVAVFCSIPGNKKMESAALSAIFRPEGLLFVLDDAGIFWGGKDGTVRV